MSSPERYPIPFSPFPRTLREPRLCVDCGAAVWDTLLHDLWHDELELERRVHLSLELERARDELRNASELE